MLASQLYRARVLEIGVTYHNALVPCQGDSSNQACISTTDCPFSDMEWSKLAHASMREVTESSRLIFFP